jgi:hypothetical protein
MSRSRRPAARYRYGSSAEFCGRCTVGVMSRRKRKATEPKPTAKPKTSDQAPGEEVVQVNDQYAGGGPPPDVEPSEHAQHPTGG